MVETRSGRRFAVLFFVAAFLVLLLGRWLKPVDNAALSAAAPFAAIISASADAVGDTVSGLFEGPRLRGENLTLRHQNAALLKRLILLQDQAHENALLRRMLQYEDANNRMDYLVARVIGTDPANPGQYIIINRGSRDGLRPRMSVVDQNGYFVGTVADLTSNAAKVLLVLSPSSSVGAIDLSTHATGLVEGQFGARPQFRFAVASSVIHRNDLIVTSGEYNLFPRMILLGQVARVIHRSDELFQTADLKPAADFGNLELVQVIRNFVPSAPNKLINQ